MASVARNPRRRALVEQRANAAGFKEAHPDSVHKQWSEQSPHRDPANPRVDPDETRPRVRDDDRGVRRDGSSNRVCGRGTRRNSDRADAHPSLPAYLQRDRAIANHASSHAALDASENRGGTRATVQRVRSHFQHSELERGVISARVHN